MAENRSPRQTASEQYRLLNRWVADHYNVMTTEDGEHKYHVATTTSSSVAQHIADLHNRTFGDGQDAFEELASRDGTRRQVVGVRPIEPRPGETVTLDPGEVLNDSVDAAVWAREFMKRFQDTQADEGIMLSWFANAIENGKRSVANKGVVAEFSRRFRDEGPPIELSHALDAAEYANPGNREIRDLNMALRSAMNPPRRRPETVEVVVKLDSEQIRRLVQNEVAKQAGETVWSPERMALRLRALGFEVLNPDVQRLMRDLEQDFMEQVPSGAGARDYLLKERQTPYSVADAERRAFHAGFEEARVGASIPVFRIPADDITAAKNLLTTAGFRVTDPSPSYPREERGYWNCGVLHGSESHTHITQEGALKCMKEQMDLTPDQLDLLAQAALDQMTDPEQEDR